MQKIKIAILEDDLETISVLTKKLAEFENQSPSKEISVIVLSEYIQAEQYPAEKINEDFDVILLDRDCKLCGSFHVIFEADKFNPDKVISISSTPEWNKQAVENGVRRVVFKDFQNLDKFGSGVISEISDLLNIN